MREYVLYCDESKSTGKYFGNFYGGVLIDSANLDHCVQQLLQRKEDLNLHSEVKYQRITEQYLEKYLSLMELFFDGDERKHALDAAGFEKAYSAIVSLKGDGGRPLFTAGQAKSRPIL